MNKTIQERISKATVKTLGKPGEGRGVLVSGKWIITAAHCLEFDWYKGVFATHAIRLGLSLLILLAPGWP